MFFAEPPLNCFRRSSLLRWSGRPTVSTDVNLPRTRGSGYERQDGFIGFASLPFGAFNSSVGSCPISGRITLP